MVDVSRVKIKVVVVVVTSSVIRVFSNTKFGVL